MGEKKLRKVERGGEVASQGAAVCVSLNVCVSPSAAVIKKKKKCPNESRAGFILHGKLTHP